VNYHELGLLWEIKEMGLTGKLSFCKKPYEEKFHYSMFIKRVPASVIDEVDKALKSLETEGTLLKI